MKRRTIAILWLIGMAISGLFGSVKTTIVWNTVVFLMMVWLMKDDR